MKRIMAFILCWVMLLSQMAMVAEAMQTKEQSDILYLEENGIHVEDGGQVFMDNAPLGRSDDTERYAPSVPKFIPEALKNLGLGTREDEGVAITSDASEKAEYEDPLADVIFNAVFNKDKVMLYAYAGEDAESEYFKNAMGVEVEITPTISPLWYTLPRPVSDETCYHYIRAEDVTFVEKRQPKKVAYYTDEETGITVHIPELPATRELRVAPVAAERAPMREVPNRVMGERTLLASYSVGVFSRDGGSWSGEKETQICFTMPELPELEQHGCYYAECVDAQGNVEELPVYVSFWANVLFVDAPLDREIFVYSVDYPEDTGILSILEAGQIYISDAFDGFNTGHDFSEVVDVSFSAPDAVELVPVYNEEGEKVDWEVVLLKPFFSLETFSFTYRDGADGTRATYNNNGSGTWDWSYSLTGDTYYIYDKDGTTVKIEKQINAKSGTSTIRVGAKGTSKVYNAWAKPAEKVVAHPGATLQLLIDSECNSTGWVRQNASKSMLHAYGGAIKCVGGHSKYVPTDGGNKESLKFDGNQLKASVAMIYIEDQENDAGTNKNGSVRLFNSQVYDAYNLDGNGGGVYIKDGGTLVLNDMARIRNNHAENGGGVYVASGRINVSKTVLGADDVSSKARAFIYVNEADGYGGGICMVTCTLDPDSGTSLTLDTNHEGKAYGNTAVSGGNMCLFSGGTSKISGAGTLNVKNGSATNGGGLFITNNSSNKLTISQSVTFTGNSATDGGGLYVNGGTLNIGAAVTVSSNTASRGGGLFGGTAGTINITSDKNLTIQSNTGNYGAGVFVGRVGCTLTIGGSGSGQLLIDANTSKGSDGGGVFVEGGTFQVNHKTTIQGHTVTNRGGGLFVTGWDGTAGTVNFTARSFVTGNNAKDGAGIYTTTLGKVTSTGISVRTNKASNNGGGVYNAGTFEAKSGDFYLGSWSENAGYGNTATANGAGIYQASGTFTINGRLRMGHNIATADGGGIYVNDGTITLKGNTHEIGAYTYQETKDGQTINHPVVGNEANRGGAIFVNGGKIVFDSTANIFENKAYEGAGVFLAGGIFETTGSARPAIRGGSGITSKNSGRCHHGGGIHAQDGIIRINSSADICVYENHGEWGPGIFFGITGGTVTIDGTGAGRLWSHENHIQGSTSSSGVLIEACTVELKHKWFISRQVTGGTGTEANDGDGNSDGALTIQQNSSGQAGTLNIHGGAELEIEKCVGKDRSGGVMVSSNASLNVLSDENGQGTLNITGCSTSADGGAIRIIGGTITNAGTINIDKNGDVKCSAVNGGGIYISGGTFSSTGTVSVTGSTASGNGGGIYASGGANTTFSIEGSGNVIKDNEAGTWGGGICANITSMSIKNCQIDSNDAQKGHGGGIFIYDSNKPSTPTYSLTLDGCDIIYNKCLNSYNETSDTDRGAGIYAENVNLTITGGSISNNETKYGKGGGICYRTPNGSLKITDCDILDNTATQNGGGIYVDNGTLVDLYGVDISGNSGSYGGGIYTTIPLTVQNSTARSSTIGKSGFPNTASLSGGGIYVNAAVAVTLKGATSVSYNEANGEHGGGVFMESATLALQGTASIHDNKATKNGGGIYYKSGSITVSDTPSIYSNTAQHGGGIFAVVALTISGALTIGGSDSTKGNKATNGHGGGIYSAENLTLEGVTIQFNTANSHGGGIYVAQDQNMTFTGTNTVSNNTANVNGGGLWINGGQFDASGSTSVSFANNYAGSHGGGLFLYYPTKALLNNCSFTGNKAKNSGGGIYCESTDLSLTLNSANAFDNNRSGSDASGNAIASHSGNGGGIFVTGSGNTLTLDGVEMNNNKALRGSGDPDGGHGGAVSIGKAGATNYLVIKNGVKIHDNSAGAHGGGVNTDDVVVTVTAGSPSIYQNTAGVNGGGLYLGGGTLDSTGVTKLTFDNNYAGNYGGGIFMYTSSNVTLTNCTVTNNKAAKCGGGISSQSCNLTLDSGCKIDTNYAGSTSSGTANTKSGNGGGIFFIQGESTTTFTLSLDGTEISNNKAYFGTDDNSGGHGGGISIGNSILTIKGTTKITGNIASKQGGGINLDNTALTVSAGTTTLEKNQAGTSGGGVMVNNGGSFTVSASTTANITENSAANGGGIYVNSGSLINNGTLNVEGNKATAGSGGGIYLASDASFTPGTLTVNSNTASANGGGIYTKIALTLTSATIGAKDKSNYAGTTQTIGTDKTVTYSPSGTGGNGGGIYVDEVKLTLNGTSVQYNQALASGEDNGNGGGIYLSENASLEAVTKSPQINYNTASANGGGIYNAGEVAFNVRGQVNGNTATNGSGGGIYNVGTAKAEDDGISLSGNKAEKGNGGGIYNAGTFTATKLLYVGSWTTVDKNNGNKAVNGAGIYQAGGAFSLASLNMGHNIASGDGGGMYIADGTMTFTGGKQQIGAWIYTYNETKTPVVGNEAVNGAGIYLAGGSLEIKSASTGVLIGDNKASGNGGGIYTKVDLTLTSKTQVGFERTDANFEGILGNSATNGGGVYVEDKALTLSGAKLMYNTSSKAGGGIYMLNGSVTAQSSSSIAINTANTHGGGIYMKNGTVTVEGASTISENNATTSGGGVCMEGDAAMKLTVTGANSAISGNTAGARGGGVWMNVGTIGVESTAAISDNSAGTHGGGIYMQNGTVTVKGGSKINGNDAATSGGGVCMEGDDAMKLTVTGVNSAISGNTAGGNGGGVWMNSGTVTVEDSSKINGNTCGVVKTADGSIDDSDAGGNGGGVWANNGTIIVKNKATVEGNTATIVKKQDGNESGGNGGGIYVTSSAKLELTGNVDTKTEKLDGTGVFANHAAYGGGVYINSAKAGVTMTDSSISNNESRTNGGGVWMSDGALTMNGASEIRDNTAGHGAGVRQGGGTLTMNDTSTVVSNDATKDVGGGFYLTGGEVVANGTSSIKENTAKTTGGGIHMTGGTVAAEGTLIVSHNKATTDGGGVYMTGGSLSLRGPDTIANASEEVLAVAYNTAGTNGGGIYMSGSAAVTLTGEMAVFGNTATTDGGGVYMANGTLTLTGHPSIKTNTAGNRGGGVMAQNGTITVSANSSLEVGDSSSPNNAKWGGGMFIGETGGTVTINGTGELFVRHNIAANDGGGIMVEKATLNLSTATAKEALIVRVGYNKATTGMGGGIVVNTKDGVAATLNDYITGAFNVYGNTAATYGGAIWMSGAINTNGMNIGVNSAKDDARQINQAPNGGGLYNDGGTFTASGTVNVVYNEATTGNGGGMFLSGAAKFSATSGTVTISNNVANKDGGGVYVAKNASFTATGTSKLVAETNTATTNRGGGLYATEAKAVTITGSGGNSFKSNTSQGHGGALCAYNCSVELANCTVELNVSKHGHAGGVFLKDSANSGCTMKLTNCDIKSNRCENENGQGINGNTSTDDDRGAGIYVELANLTISGGSVTGNTTKYGRGGGIFFSGGDRTLSVSGCTISGNEAHNTNETTDGISGHGGGIYVAAAKNVSLTDSVITGNKADATGGGLYVGQAKDTKQITVTLSGGEISQNTAEYGAGIYLYNNIKVTISGGSIEGNQASKGAGGIYVQNATVKITGGSITANTAQKEGGGVYLHNNSTLEVSKENGLTASPIRGNTSGTAGNDIYAIGKDGDTVRSTLILPATQSLSTVDGKTIVDEYWFADYAAAEKVIPNVFPSDYLVENGLYNPGRYNEYTTPVTYARRSFEEGTDPSTAYLALTLATAEDLFVDLTLTKKISDAVGKVVEPTTFIFYIKGVDDASFLLPVAIHIDPLDNSKGKEGDVTIRDLPVGFYDICEAEGWSWRYAPSTAVNSADTTKVLQEATNGDGYVEVRVTRSVGTHSVTFTNQLDNNLWLTDADYLPFLPATTGVSTVSADDEDEEDGE